MRRLSVPDTKPSSVNGKVWIVAIGEPKLYADFCIATLTIRPATRHNQCSKITRNAKLITVTRKLRVTLRVITRNQDVSITPQKCLKNENKAEF